MILGHLTINLSLCNTSSTVYDLIHSISTCRDTRVWFWWNWKCEMKHFISSWCPQFSLVQLLSHVWFFVTSWTAALQASLSITNSQSLLKLVSIGWWCHPAISSSVIPFSSYLQSFPASGSFPMSQFFESGRQSIGVSASASVLPMNIQDRFPLGWTG